MRESCVVGGVVRGGVQVRPLGFQPRDRLHEGRYVGSLGGWAAKLRAAAGPGPGGEVPAGGHGGVEVVVQQPVDRGLGFCWVIGGGQGAGVFAEQVVQR